LGYVLKVGPIGEAIIMFSRNIETPIADIIKYRKGAFLFLNGVYAILSIIMARIHAPIAARLKAIEKGSLKAVIQKKPIYAPIMITPP
jgi:hypothetical protein